MTSSTRNNDQLSCIRDHYLALEVTCSRILNILFPGLHNYCLDYLYVNIYFIIKHRELNVTPKKKSQSFTIYCGFIAHDVVEFILILFPVL